MLQLEKGDEGIIRLLDASNEVGFHLSLVSQIEGKPLLCDFSLPNIFISSSNWDGNQSSIFDCTTGTNVSLQEHLIRFPQAGYSGERHEGENGNIGSYILLPSKIQEKSYRASGVFISNSDFVKTFLPGFNNRQSFKVFLSNVNSLFFK